VEFPLEQLCDFSPALFAAVDQEGVVVGVRGAWHELLGIRSEELLGKQFDTFLHPDDVQAAVEVQTRAHGTLSSVAYYESRLGHADGSYRWIAWTARPAVDGISLAFGIDVTARKLELLELEAARSQLRSVGSIAHDFNNLLTVMGGGVELLGMELPPPPSAARDILQELARTVERAGDMTKRLVGVVRTKAPTSTAPAANERIDLVDGVSDLVMPRLDGLSLALQLRERHPELPMVVITGYCEPAQLERLRRMHVPCLQKPVSPSALLEELQRVVAATPRSPGRFAHDLPTDR
jgi:PAS domain S-box-containing protein